MDRRAFVKKTCMGSAAFLLEGFGPNVKAGVLLPEPPPIEVRGLDHYKPSPLGMPGLFPGRVVQITDPRSIDANRVSQVLIRQMIERGMRELTGESSLRGAWAKFVEPSDVVGLKINPSGAPACCTSPEIVREVIRGLQSVGVPDRNVVIFDRYGYEMDIGSYQTLVPAGVRVEGIQNSFHDDTGYDPNVYCDARFFVEWETRSYMASLVSRDLTKIINLPTMKDHSAAGVTGCLKNLGYGTFNNVARSHRAPYSFTDPLIGVMCATEPLRSKAVLHVMDGTRVVWHGGPLTQVQDFIAPAGTLLIGTDPVAMDTVELRAIERKRKEEGAPSVWSLDPASITEDGEQFYHDPTKNLFYRRPGHIASAGKLGLGISDLGKIDLRDLPA